MAYGRIDVYWPDGPIESYQLEKPVVAIGRSTGNDIVLDTTAVSRYHVSLTRHDQQVALEDLDSVNGTYVDGDRIKPHEPILLRGGEEIQVGDVRMIFQPEDETEDELETTRPLSTPENIEVTRRIERSQTTFKFELDPPRGAVTPGAYVQASVHITNTGPDTDVFSVEVNGIPKEWVRLDRAHVELDPGEDATMLISFKPLRRSESAPGDYPVNVLVYARSAPAQPADAPMILTVRSFGGFGMALDATRIEPGSAFEVHTHNQGSGSLPLVFSGAAPGAGLIFELQPSAVTLAPGEHKTIHGRVRPVKAALVGPQRERRFDILARAQDPSGFLAAIQGTLIEKPALPLWVPTLIIPIILAVLILGAIAVVAVLSRPRPPVITGLTASATRVFEGDTVTLSWTMQDANQVSVSVDNGPPVAVDPQQQKFSQVMSVAGDHLVTVQARNGDTPVSQSVKVTVIKPLKINAFAVDPNPLLRNVSQKVTITWNVDGAQSVQFQGIEALTGKPDPASQPPTGQIVLNGTPRDTVALKLIATGTDGNTLEQSVQVEIKNPVCKVSLDKVDLRSGPGMNYPVSGTIGRDAELSPDGRDQSGQWIHLVPSPNPQAWVLATAVSCQGFSTDTLTAIAAVPPTPIPPTLTLTPVPPTPIPTQPPTHTPTPRPTQPPPTVPILPTATSAIMLMLSRQ